MTTKEHEQFFFEFVKAHDLLKHLSYGDATQDQKIVAVLVNDDDASDRELETYVPYYADYIKRFMIEGTVIIDPNYDNIYYNFINIDFAEESVNYIKSLVESKTTREEVTQIVVDLIIKPLIDSNIQANTVYIVVHSHWNTDWADEVIKV